MNRQDTWWFTLKGRADRRDYLLGWCTCFLAALPILGMIISDALCHFLPISLVLVMIVAVTCVLVPVSVRRAHDIGLSGLNGWRIFSLFFQNSDLRENIYGKPVCRDIDDASSATPFWRYYWLIGVIPTVALGAIWYVLVDKILHGIGDVNELYGFVKWSCFWAGTYNFIITGALGGIGMMCCRENRSKAFVAVLCGIASVRIVDFIIVLCTK